MTLLLSVLLTKYYTGDHITKNEMGGDFRAYEERRGAYRFWWENMTEDLDVNGMIILKQIFKK